MTSSADTPVLWHIPISHYNEKVRWALALKGISHVRRAPAPPSHIAVALWATRGRGHTLPMLVLDGRAIADSTAIIAELERRWPHPPLYPADPALRARALALEDVFDEQLGPAMRLFAFHEILRDPVGLAEVAGGMLPGRAGERPAVRRVAARAAAAYVGLRFGAGDATAARDARMHVLAALDRLETELAAGTGGYLVGDRFSVADLTAASLLYPVILPPEGPRLPPPTAGYEEFRREVRDRPGFAWVAEMFARHRRVR